MRNVCLFLNLNPIFHSKLTFLFLISCNNFQTRNRGTLSFLFWSAYTHPLTLYLSLFNCLLLSLQSLQCIIANLDANDEKNSAVSKKYEVQGFPTLKFFPKGQSEPIDYEGGRSEEDLVKFLNEKCRTQRKVGGGLNDKVSSVCNTASRRLRRTKFCSL